MARPDLILAALASFVGLWGLSLVFRGWRWRIEPGARRCPSCRRGVPAGDSLACPACGYEARTPADLAVRARHWPLVGWGLGVAAVSPVVFWAALYVHSWMSFDDAPRAPSLWSAAAAGVAAFGAMVVALGLRGDRSHGRRRCPGCWYDMSGIASLRCPECGRTVPHARHLYRARRRTRVVLAGVLVMAGSVVPYEVPRVREGGWVAAVPTVALIAALPWLPESLVDGVSSGSVDWTLAGRVDEDLLWGWQRALLARRCAGLAASARPRAIRNAAGVASALYSSAPAPAGYPDWYIAAAANTFRRFLDAPVPAPAALVKAAHVCSWRHEHVFSAADLGLAAGHLGSPFPAEVVATCSMLSGAPVVAVGPAPREAAVLSERLLAGFGHPNRTLARNSLLAAANLLPHVPDVGEGLRRLVVTSTTTAGRDAAAALAHTAALFPGHADFFREQLDSGPDHAAAHSFFVLVNWPMPDPEILTSDDAVVAEAIRQLGRRRAFLDYYLAALAHRPESMPPHFGSLLALLDGADPATAATLTETIAAAAAPDPALAADARGALLRLLSRLAADPAGQEHAPRVRAAMDSLPE